MNTHKHARLTFLRRLEMVQQLIAHQVCVPEAARAYGVTAPTVRKWLGRFLAQGQAGLADASSRPTVSPRAIAPAKALAIVELRRKRLTQARIAQALGVSASTVSRVLARAGLSHLADLEPAEPVVRYEHQAPGDLLHIDIKKLGRIQRPGHRVTGNRRDTVEGAGWDFVFVAIDDHARVAFTDIHPDERFPSAVQFLKDAVAYYQRLGVTIQRLLTDNGSAFRSRAFAALCHELGIKHRFTRPYRPQTNGKAERFIQSALREWAYAHTYQNSQHRADAMKSWLHHYNWHRPHHRARCTHLQTQPGRIQPIDSSQLEAVRVADVQRQVLADVGAVPIAQIRVGAMRPHVQRRAGTQLPAAAGQFGIVRLAAEIDRVVVRELVQVRGADIRTQGRAAGQGEIPAGAHAGPPLHRRLAAARVDHLRLRLDEPALRQLEVIAGLGTARIRCMRYIVVVVAQPQRQVERHGLVDTPQLADRIDVEPAVVHISQVRAQEPAFDPAVHDVVVIHAGARDAGVGAQIEPPRVQAPAMVGAQRQVLHAQVERRCVRRIDLEAVRAAARPEGALVVAAAQIALALRQGSHLGVEQQHRCALPHRHRPRAARGDLGPYRLLHLPARLPFEFALQPRTLRRRQRRQPLRDLPGCQRLHILPQLRIRQA
ncbi:transposase, IS481 family [Bordetella pertussis STO1-CHOC-0018]|nr:transposase, IS481 family [Bordetella pertussis STO1-CHOC-0018]